MRVKWGKMTGLHKRSEESNSAHLRVPLTPAPCAVSEEAVPRDNADKDGWARGLTVNAATPKSADEPRSGHQVNQQRLCRWTSRSRAALRI